MPFLCSAASYDQPAYIEYGVEKTIDKFDFVVNATADQWTDTGIGMSDDSTIEVAVQGSVFHEGTYITLYHDNIVQPNGTINGYQLVNIRAGDHLTVVSSEPTATGKIGSTSILVNGYFSGTTPAAGTLNIAFPGTPPAPSVIQEDFKLNIMHSYAEAINGNKSSWGSGYLQVVVSGGMPSISDKTALPLSGSEFKGTPTTVAPANSNDSSPRLWIRVYDSGYTNNSGAYYVTIKRINTERNISKIINFVLEKVTIKVKDVTERMYKGVIDGSGFKTAVKASLILYVILYGMFFVLALVPMTQMELVIRLVKVSMVSFLMSDTSWEFFTGICEGDSYSTQCPYSVLRLFADGRDYAIQAVSGVNPDNILTLNEVKKGQDVFVFLDKTIGRFFHDSTWIKMAALLGQPILGWVMFTMIIACIWWFLITGIAAVMAYIVALIALSLLIAIAPIFLIFMLFSQTKPMFDAWVGHMMNFALQPVILIAALALMNEIMVVIFYQTLAFPTHRECIFDITSVFPWVPFPCLLYFPVPGDWNPIVRLTYELMFVVITKMIVEFIDFAPSLVGQLTGENVIENISTSRYGTVSHLDQNLKGLIGQDKKSIHRRDGIKVQKSASRKQDDKSLTGGDGF